MLALIFVLALLMREYTWRTGFSEEEVLVVLNSEYIGCAALLERVNAYRSAVGKRQVYMYALHQKLEALQRFGRIKRVPLGEAGLVTDTVYKEMYGYSKMFSS